MKLTPEDKEKILKIINDLKKSRELILVEGKRDAEALQKLGIPKKRILEMSQKDIPSIGHKLSGNAIDLIDIDRKGKQLSARLRKHTKLHIDTYFKRRIFHYLESPELEDLWDLIRKNFI